MLKSIEQLQNALLTPKSYQAAVTMNRIFDLELSSLCKIQPCHNSGITALDLDRIDERYLLSGTKNGELSIHDVLNSTGKLSYTAKAVCNLRSASPYAHKHSIVTVQWYPFDTGLFMTSGMDHKLKLWDTNNLKPVDSFSMEYKINCHNMSKISTQHSLIAVALKYPHIVLIDPRSGSRCHELRAHKTGVSSVRWSPLSEYLLASGGVDNKIFFWDIRSAKGYLRALDQHNGAAIGNKKDLITAHDGLINALKFTDDGLHLVSHGTDSRLRLWDVSLCKNTLVNFGPLHDVFAGFSITMDFCCDSSLPVLFVPCNNNVNVYDLFSGCKLKTLIGHFSLVSACVFRSRTQELYSGGNDMNILMWTPDTGKDLEVGNSPQNDTHAAHSDDSDNWSSDDG